MIIQMQITPVSVPLYINVTLTNKMHIFFDTCIFDKLIYCFSFIFVGITMWNDTWNNNFMFSDFKCLKKVIIFLDIISGVMSAGKSFVPNVKCKHLAGNFFVSVLCDHTDRQSFQWQKVLLLQCIYNWQNW